MFPEQPGANVVPQYVATICRRVVYFSLQQPGANEAHQNVMLRRAHDLFLVLGATGSECGPQQCVRTAGALFPLCGAAGSVVEHHNVLQRTADDLFLLHGTAGSTCGPPQYAATNCRRLVVSSPKGSRERLWPSTVRCYGLPASCFCFQEQLGAPAARHNVLLRTAGDLFLLAGAAGNECGPPQYAATTCRGLVSSSWSSRDRLWPAMASCLCFLEQPGELVAHHNVLL